MLWMSSHTHIGNHTFSKAFIVGTKGGRSTKTILRVSTTVNQKLTRHTIYDRMQSQQQGHQRSIHTRPRLALVKTR